MKFILEELKTIKNQALNRSDTFFEQWYLKARDTVAQYAPSKLPTFDEITFASDFFLSKPLSEREGINDRIALISDLELAAQILHEAKSNYEVAEGKREREVSTTQLLIQESQESLPGVFATTLPDTKTGWAYLDQLLISKTFSDREREEAREILRNLKNSLEEKDPDWDRIKRGVKFFLDFDRDLAIQAVPFLMRLYQIQQGANRG